MHPEDLGIDDWVRIGEEGPVGRITEIDDPTDPSRISIEGVDGREWIVPFELVYSTEHPKIDKAANAIQETLSREIKSWSVVDTLPLRRNIVRIVLETLDINVNNLEQ